MKYFTGLFRVFFIIALTLSHHSILTCLAQETDTMEKFNIELFNRNKDGFAWVYNLPDDTKVRQYEDLGIGYVMEATPLHSAYTDKKIFNYNGQLIGTIQSFYSIFAGKSKEYDGNGILIRETNLDEGFAFSIEDLAAKMLADYKIDILNSNNVYKLNRGQNFNPSFSSYQVYCYDLTSPAPDQALTAFLVDGSTGEVLHTLQTHIMEPTSVLNAYLEKLARMP